MELGILFKKNYGEFAKKALETFASGNDKNVVFSPFSMFMLLAILADATKGEARKEILNVIARGIYKDLTGTFAGIQEFLTDNETFMSSNALCVKKSLEYSIVPEFREKLAKYSGELFATENCAREINEWVNEKTKGMIEEIVKDPIPSFMAVLMNAVAFEAKWCEPYQKSDIKKEKFTNADCTKNTVYMLKSTENNYIEDDFFTGFVKPYEGKNYSFMALLPKNESMEFFDESLQYIDFIKLLKSAKCCKVDVSMPEFKYSCENGLIDFCKELGMNTVFSQNADFSPFSVLPIEISEMIQKAFIEVNRKGTKAAAVTYLRIGIRAALPVPREIKVVKLDRPFIYAVIHNETGLPIFVGTIKHIEKISSEKRKNKESIWDYKPTEEEIKKICEQLDLTEKTIITESRDNDEYRLACLCKLFIERKKYRERDRIIDEFCDKQKIPFDTAY
ncbi:serpin family protein [bacterium]|nr:serpin family protein [bacterium]